MRIKRYLKNFIHNMKYILTRDLYREDAEKLLQNLQVSQWNIKDKFETGLKIFDEEETLDVLLEKPMSFCRFGDGEVDLMEGKSIPFQTYDKKLADIFKEILSQKQDDLYVGINFYYFHTLEKFDKVNGDYYRLYSPYFGKFFACLCNRETQYIDAGFNSVYYAHENQNLEEHYRKIKTLFRGRKLVVFSGEGVITKLPYNVFDEAESIEYEFGPSKNSFEKFDELLERAQKYDKSKILCFVLGPTSKALVYKLTQKGYMSWDIGHMCKDYNAYMMNADRTPENIADFFAPD